MALKLQPVIAGTDSADLLIGTSYSDLIFGNAGNDVIRGSAGADTIDGGDDIDTADYRYSDAAVDIDLTRATQIGGQAEDDTLISIENVTGSDFADMLRGDGNANVLTGGKGGDSLFGGGGHDVLIGGIDGQVDFLSGGSGVDTVSYEGSNVAMHVELGSGVVFGSAEAKATVVETRLPNGIVLELPVPAIKEDTLVSIENVTGSGGDDDIVGNGGANRLDGRAGSDNIDGGGGADIIVGGRGSDELTGGTGADTFVFLNVSDSNAADGEDIIWDFNPGEDKIDVSAMDADTTHSGNQSFTVVDAFTGHAGELRLTFFNDPVLANGDQSVFLVSGDVNGDGLADFTINVAPPPLSLDPISATDFIL